MPRCSQEEFGPSNLESVDVFVRLFWPGDALKPEPTSCESQEKRLVEFWSEHHKVLQGRHEELEAKSHLKDEDYDHPVIRTKVTYLDMSHQLDLLRRAHEIVKTKKSLADLHRDETARRGQLKERLGKLENDQRHALNLPETANAPGSPSRSLSKSARLLSTR
ncbi:hypothetical protein JCM16303_001212 [Sporobolomyces ruberrimus]